MTHTTVDDNDFLNKDIDSVTMTSRRLFIEEYINYFNLLAYTFDDEDQALWPFSDGEHWYKDGCARPDWSEKGVIASENIQGYVIQGDLSWDDEDNNGMIDMYHQTQDTGYIADIYDATHELWNGCGYEWGHPTSDSIEEIHNIALENKYFNLFDYRFTDINLYFGDWYRVATIDNIDITEDFSETNLPSVELSERTPTTVSGWINRGI